MPEITRFYGIIIKIFFLNEHNPPHFHAIYGEYNGEFLIETCQMIEGDLPVKAQKLIEEWWLVHKEEIENMWNNKKLQKLPPLV